MYSGSLLPAVALFAAKDIEVCISDADELVDVCGLMRTWQVLSQARCPS